MLHDLHVIDDCEPRSGAMNMAVDEALLASVSVATLRSYQWREPAISFGYFSSFAEAEGEAAGREMVRRWTGGGIVPHGRDLTYSLIMPQRQLDQFRSARAIYTFVHAAIGRALSQHVTVELAAANAPKVSDSCFANPVVADVLANGRKIAGAAQRRTRSGLLHQGSIQYEGLPPSFLDSFAAELCGSSVRHSLGSDLVHQAERIASEKYATAEWLRLR